MPARVTAEAAGRGCPARGLSLRQAEGDQGDAAFDEQEMNGHLAQTPVQLGPRHQLRLGRGGDPHEEPVPAPAGAFGDQAERLGDPGGPIGGLIRHDQGHLRLILPRISAFV